MPAWPDLGVADETEELWARIRARITHRPAIEGQGTVIPTLAVMEDNEVRQVVKALVTMCKAIVIEHAGGTPSPHLPGYLPD